MSLLLAYKHVVVRERLKKNRKFTGHSREKTPKTKPEVKTEKSSTSKTKHYRRQILRKKSSYLKL